MITEKSLAAEGLYSDANDLRMFLMYEPWWENRIIGMTRGFFTVIFQIDDGSKVKFDLLAKTSRVYPKDYKDENRTKEMVNEDISRNIKRIMYIRGVNQSQLAEVCEVSQQTISNYLKCMHGSIPVWMLLKIANFLQIDISELYQG